MMQWHFLPFYAVPSLVSKCKARWSIAAKLNLYINYISYQNSLYGSSVLHKYKDFSGSTLEP